MKELENILSLERAEDKANGLGWTVMGSARTDDNGCGIIIARRTTTHLDSPLTEWVTWSYHPESGLSCGRYTTDAAQAWGDFYQRHADNNVWFSGKQWTDRLLSGEQ